MTDRVELQLELDAPRALVFPLFATAEGLGRWLDAAELDPRVGGAVRVRLRDSEATGEVLAFAPPQHVSFSWQWTAQPLAAPSVVALDAIDHGKRTHVTLRHVGLPTRSDVELHEQMWRHWLDRFAAAARMASHPNGISAVGSGGQAP